MARGSGGWEVPEHGPGICSVFVEGLLAASSPGRRQCGEAEQGVLAEPLHRATKVTQAPHPEDLRAF